MDESLDIRGEIQREVTSIDCGAQTRPYPSLNVELSPAIRVHGAVILSKRSKEAVKGRKSERVRVHPVQRRKRATNCAPVLLCTRVRQALRQRFEQQQAPLLERDESTTDRGRSDNCSRVAYEGQAT